MASTPKQVNGNATSTNGNLGKRKKSRGSKGSYLSKWLDKTMQHIQESTPSMETYESYVNPNMNWVNNAQFAAGYDPCKFGLYGCTPEPMSLPTMPTYYNPAMMPPFYSPEGRYMPNVNKQPIQRSRVRRRSEHIVEEVHTPSGTPNGTLNNTSYLQPKNYSDSQDYASLPPIVTSVGDTTSNSDLHVNDKDDCSNARRYSDPCVQGLPDVARETNGDADSVSEASSGLSGSQVGSRLLTYLLDQITTLKITNERLNKDLQEAKVELNNIRHHNTIWQRGSGSIGGTPTHTPLSNGAAGQYSPGFLTELVREIRDATRVREEAFYSRVRNMMHDRSDNGLGSSEKFAEKTLDEIKAALRASEADKRRMMDRIVKLEEELRVLRVSNGVETNDRKNGNVEDSDAELMRMRKELADMRSAKQHSEEQALKLERLVTKLRSNFNGMQLSNGPDSLPSEPDHEPSRARRPSNNSSNNSTVVFGPVTDL